MPQLEIPESVYRPLAERAARHGITVQQEAVHCLESALREKDEVEATLDELRSFRDSLGTFVTEEQLQQAKREGRE